VLLLEPQRTQYDWNFQLFGFPIRVHPFFWLLALISGLNLNDPAYLVIWMGVVFVSILVHELGHAFMIRRMGRPAHIVLYAMGGLAIEGSSDPYGFDSSYSSRQRTPQEQVLISAAGPGAGFALAALVALLVFVTRGRIEVEWINGLIPFFGATYPIDADVNLNLIMLVNSLLYVNIFWGLLNLVPVIPLDGGQIAQAILTAQDPWQGMTKALWLSIWAGGIMAVAGLLMFQQMFIVLLFASLAYSSYVTLQQLSGGGGRDW
jgi:stage IV sporulation protein FB